MSCVLVTGASGFIGRYTCIQLRRQGLEVIGVDRHTAEGTLACDLTDRGAVSALFHSHRFNAVIHLAAVLPSAAAADPFRATEVNIDTSVNLLEQAISNGCRRFIFGSSSSVYGTSGLSRPISENEPATPIDIYGGAKRYIEILGTNFHAKSAIEFAALRIATVLGSGARNTSSPWRSEIFEKLGSVSPQTISLPYSADDPLTVVHAEDVARMLTIMAQRRSLASTIYNTPAQFVNAAEIKRAVEHIDPNVSVALAGRTRPLAPLADGKKFVEEFGFEMPSLEDHLLRRAHRTPNAVQTQS